LKERTIRFLFGHKKQRAFLKNQLLNFLTSCEESKVELIVTVNLVLTDLKKKQFSVFYGQDFDDEHKYAITKPILLTSAVDLHQLPPVFRKDKVNKLFERIFQKRSGLTVHEIVNSVYILRTLVTY